MVGLDEAHADLVQRLLNRAVQGFAGEAGEVDDDVLAGKRLLDEGAQADRRGGEDRRSGDRAPGRRGRALGSGRWRR